MLNRLCVVDHVPVSHDGQKHFASEIPHGCGSTCFDDAASIIESTSDVRMCSNERREMMNAVVHLNLSYKRVVT